MVKKVIQDWSRVPLERRGVSFVMLSYKRQTASTPAKITSRLTMRADVLTNDFVRSIFVKQAPSESSDHLNCSRYFF